MRRIESRVTMPMMCASTLAELPTTGGAQAQFVGGAVNASETPERDLSVQLSGWMLMEAAYAVTVNEGTLNEEVKPPS